MSEPTTERLAKSLEAAKAPEWMIKKARQGYYDDYKSPIATPLVALYHDSSLAGLPNSFRQKIIDGEFDSTREEADEWAASPEGQALFNDLLKGKNS